jgi:stress response protein YsnF
MTQSVVAVFESREQAEKAKQQLLAAGIPADRMSLHQGSESDATSAAAGRSSTVEESESGIGHFFRSIFGMDDDRPAYYEEAARRGHVTLVADASREEEVEQIRAILERFDVVDIDERATQWRSGTEGGQSERALAGRTAQADTMADPSSATIPVIEEDLQIGKREVERGRVRVYSRVMERPVEETVQLREEHARVTRQPANRPATEADFTAFKEGAVEIRETAEVPVVEKQARVVEEVQVGKHVEEHSETVRDKVRKTEVRVEEAPAASQSGKPRRGEKGKTRNT